MRKSRYFNLLAASYTAPGTVGSSTEIDFHNGIIGNEQTLNQGSIGFLVLPDASVKIIDDRLITHIPQG